MNTIKSKAANGKSSKTKLVREMCGGERSLFNENDQINPKQA